VLDAFKFSWDVLSVERTRRKLEAKASLPTIRRALAKLCDIGIIERLPAESKGREVFLP